MHLRPELVEMSRLAGAEGPDAPEATPTREAMNAPGPLHGIAGLNPARYASPALGQETVDEIVSTLAAWVAQALREVKG
jgi:creatinine amidohydrolase/Fe(II)-dependent formamide hydrolase-like protein